MIDYLTVRNERKLIDSSKVKRIRFCFLDKEKSTMDGAGSIAFWGYSPSLNLNELIKDQSNDETRRCLLIGGSDVRHLLNTFAFSDSPIEIFLLETQLEIYARQLLLLQLIFRPSDEYGIQEKVQLYLDLFGNLHVNTHTNEYLKKSSKQLIESISSLSGKFSLNDDRIQIDLSLLKFKEKDILESIFQMFRSKSDKDKFPADKAWEFRLRQYLGTRYDSRKNSFDWDLHMKLSERGFKRLNAHEYADWRETGLAFRSDYQEQNEPNRTLSSPFVFQSSDGVRQARRGFWSDIVCGPFLAHGFAPIDHDDPELDRKANDKFVKTATDISEYNLTKLFTLVQQRTQRINVVFLPLNSISDLCSKSVERFRHFQFDLIYVSCSLTHFLDEQKQLFSKSLMFERSSLILELPRFILDLKNDQLEQLEKRYDELAKQIDCFPLNDVSQDRPFRFYSYQPQ